MSYYPIGKYVKFYPQGLQGKWVRAVITGYQDSYDKLRVDLAELAEVHPNEFYLYIDRGDQAYASMSGLPVHIDIPHMDLLGDDEEDDEPFWCHHYETYNSTDYGEDRATKDHFRVDSDDKDISGTIFTSKQSAVRACKRISKQYDRVCRVVHIQQKFIHTEPESE